MNGQGARAGSASAMLGCLQFSVAAGAAVGRRHRARPAPRRHDHGQGRGDRSLDAGRTQSKFDYLRSLGIALSAQDGSGLAEGMTLVTSAAVEDQVPDVVRARELGLAQLKRPELLAQMLNQAHHSIAVGGTSGKSTVTGMVGWILHACHRQPTVINGAVMKNFVTPAAPFASAVVGDPELFVGEVDEIAARLDVSVPEVVFRFARAIGILPLTGTSDPAHMAIDLSAARLGQRT